MEDQYRPLTARYLELALSDYTKDLRDPDHLQRDATLATGILLCSVSVSISTLQEVSYC
jgi:hypothetical protein